MDLSKENRNRIKNSKAKDMTFNIHILLMLITQIKQAMNHGVAMGSPLGPSLANAFLGHYEQVWLDDCPDAFKPVYYKRYDDDIFVLFLSPHHLDKFNEYLNTKHANIKFTSEKDVNRSLQFLDVLIFRNKEGFTTTAYI